MGLLLAVSARYRRAQLACARVERPSSRSPGCDPDERLAVKERERVERPKRFNVVLYNDDYTPMDFVVVVLERLFGKSPAHATQLMLQVHRSGQAVAGVYALEIAETKVAAVHLMAEGRGHPLRAGLEPE